MRQSPGSRRSPLTHARPARGALRAPGGARSSAPDPRAWRRGDRPRGRWRGRWRKAAIAVFVVFGVLLAGAAGTAVAAAGIGDDLLIARFAEVFRLVRSAYIEEIPAEELFAAAMDGVTERLDPYSVYFDPTELQDFQDAVEGNYVGIGVQVEFVNGYTTVVAPIAGGPAEKAGIRAGDRIQAVDGRDVAGKPPDIVAPLIRGEPGTTVRLTLLRGDVPLVIEVERAAIHLSTVETRTLTPEVGYLRIASFASDTGRDVRAALERLKSAGVRGLVLDLRGNPGGALSSGIEVAGYFVGPRPIVHLVERGDARRTVSGDRPAFGLPLAVLVDRGTASASELVAGAIQDHRAGVLVGEETFGKGVAQSVVDLPGGAAFKLTTMKYLTPNGRNPSPGNGLKPDVIVPAHEKRAFARVPAGRALRAGESGLAVFALQERLAAAGFDPGPADGAFGARTADALRRFQQAQGLTPTGVADAETIARLNRDPAPGERRDAELDRGVQIVQELIRSGR